VGCCRQSIGSATPDIVKAFFGQIDILKIIQGFLDDLEGMASKNRSAISRASYLDSSAVLYCRFKRRAAILSFFLARWPLGQSAAGSGF
jgi:hypothetical protein